MFFFRHVMVGANELDESKKFYDALLGALGVPPGINEGDKCRWLGDGGQFLIKLPINGEPEEVCAIVEKYSGWMSENEIPKLFINAEPGSILVGKQREFCRTWKNQKEVTVSGTHFIQEDSPHEIRKAIAEWIKVI